MLATSKTVLFPGHNHLLTTGADDLTLIIKVKGHHWWLWPGNKIFFVARTVVTWWIVAFLCCAITHETPHNIHISFKGAKRWCLCPIYTLLNDWNSPSLTEMPDVHVQFTFKVAKCLTRAQICFFLSNQFVRWKAKGSIWTHKTVTTYTLLLFFLCIQFDDKWCMLISVPRILWYWAELP